MELLQFGRSGPKVQRIGLGTMGLGGFHSRAADGDDNAIRIIEAALNYASMLIDTAENYGDGHTEELIGKAILGKRQTVLISTKFDARRSRTAEIITAAEESLRRLSTDYIDIYQPHWPNPSVPSDEIIEALRSLFKAGKIRSVGLSNFGPHAAKEIIQALGLEIVVSMQHEYNLLERTPENRLFPFCLQNKLIFQAHSPFCSGSLLVRHAANKALFELSTELNLSPAQLAIAWTLRHSGVMAIPKTSSLANLFSNLKVLELNIPADALNALSDALQPKTALIDTDLIDVSPSEGQRNYASVDDAIANRLGITPSPMDLATALKEEGTLDKPIKVKARPSSNRFILLEGRLKYWAWVIAFGAKKPIPARIENDPV